MRLSRWLPGLFWLLLAVPLWAQTLGEATRQVHDRSEALLRQLQPQAGSWGQQTAVDDLRLLAQTSGALLEALAGHDAKAVKELQLQLSRAASRLRTSRALLPEASAEATELAALDQQVSAIEARLTELRVRFDEKAALTPTPLGEQPLSAEDPAFQLYDNPHTLLIDVRDARRLASELPVGRYPNYGFGLAQPNNLDSLQVRRLVLAAWNLQRALESQFSDISEVLDEWEKFRWEYDRLGYPGSSQVVRQLERVVDRLTIFFDQVAGQPVR
jgi:hypothetical protein